MPVMQKAPHTASRLQDFEMVRSAAAALATARDLLEAGNMAEAAKWAAIAASLGDAEKLTENA
jgi:hypothetical protein